MINWAGECGADVPGVGDVVQECVVLVVVDEAQLLVRVWLGVGDFPPLFDGVILTYVGR